MVLLTFVGYLGEIESDPQNVLDLRVYYCARRGCNLCVLRGGRVQNVWNMWQKNRNDLTIQMPILSRAIESDEIGCDSQP